MWMLARSARGGRSECGAEFWERGRREGRKAAEKTCQNLSKPAEAPPAHIYELRFTIYDLRDSACQWRVSSRDFAKKVLLSTAYFPILNLHWFVSLRFSCPPGGGAFGAYVRGTNYELRFEKFARLRAENAVRMQNGS